MPVPQPIPVCASAPDEPALRVVEHRQCPTGALATEIEDFRFLQAFEQSGIGGFSLGYLEVLRNGQPVSLVPYFLTEFRLDTMVPAGLLKRILSPLRFHLACVGHPSTDIGKIDGEISAEVLRAVNQHLFSKASLIAYKMFDAVLPLEGFAIADGLPVNTLRVHNYFAQLRHNRRKNIKRRLAQSATLTFEVLDAPATLPMELASRMFTIYTETAQRADFKFEVLTLDYFLRTAPFSRFVLAFEESRLIGFVQSMVKGQRMVAKYIGMDYQRNQAHGLYFSLLLKVIEDADHTGIVDAELGPTSYYFKKLLGCSQTPTFIQYRHAHPALNWIMGRCKFLLEPSAAELR